MKLAALNEDRSDDSESEPTEESVKEAKETEALELYNQALQYQQLGNHEKAKEFYEKLLSASFLADTDESEKDDDQANHPGLAFKYSAYKNLASLAESDNDDDKAVDLYLEAAAIDDSDVTLWYKIGKLAVKLGNLRLARYAFEQGLNINSKHWPCLDELVTVLYAIGDYQSCLMIVSSAFERDASYPKGLIMRDKIYSQFSSFRNDYQHLRGMSSAKHGKCDQELASQLIDEALELRKKNSQRNVRPEPLAIVPAKHLALYTWSSLGNCLVALYDQVTSDDNSLNLCQKVNLESYCKIIVTPEIGRSNTSQKIFVKDTEDKRSTTSLKRKKFLAEESDSFSAPKRRSARVNKSKRKQEEINYLEILQDFVPEILRSGSLIDGSEDSQSQKMDTEEVSSALDASNVPDISSENEPLDVQTFVKKHMEQCGTLDLLCDYALHLSDNCQFKWPTSLVEAFLKIYSRVRPHLSFPALFAPDSIKSEIMSNAKLALVAIELTLDKWCTEKSKSSSSLSPAGSPRGNNQSATISPLKQDFLGKFFLNDLEYIAQATEVCTSLLEKEGLQFALRVNWAKVRFKMFQGQMNLAVIYLDRCKTLIELSETPLAVLLVNCKADNVIDISRVRKKLESLQRCQSLEEVHRLYESGQYQDVVDVLLSSLYHPPPVTKVGSGGMSIPERPAQLLLLQDSLMKIKDYKTCLTCAEVAFNEAVSQMTLCEAWATTFERIFQCMNSILSTDITMLDSLSIEKIQRLTQNLIKVIEVSMESGENASEVPLATVMPWILLYRIIRSKENEENQTMEVDELSTQVKAAENDKSEESPNKEPPQPKLAQVSLPLSLQFLQLGHEALGGRSWCINSDGIFLLLFVQVFWKRLLERSPALERNRSKVLRELEQCFFCLYGHPSKKAKARGLHEHGSTQIPLTWSNSEVVFEFFKPSALPTFEDKTNTVTSEVQNLFRRITMVIPQNELEVITVESVQNYIEASTDVVPKLPDNLANIERPVVSEIFYLLADSYFKNKEFSKAIKFYIHDICSNPNRFDTWAAMALARQVRLEDKLRACEQKSEGPIQKHSVSTLRCFKRALEINSSNTNLWGEYGSLSYCLHSYASRQLNQVEALTPENQKTLEERREDMLSQAQKCFNEALHKPDNDEPWLQYYMLGKIAEKMCKPPEDYLESYLKALEELDKDDAEYPRKITYHNPPNLALETLEVAFRFHSSTLKLLVRCEDERQCCVLNDYLNRVSRCPFYEAKSKANKEDDQVSKISQEKSLEEKPSTPSTEAEKSNTENPTIPTTLQSVNWNEANISENSESQYPPIDDKPVILDANDSGSDIMGIEPGINVNLSGDDTTTQFQVNEIIVKDSKITNNIDNSISVEEKHTAVADTVECESKNIETKEDIAVSEHSKDCSIPANKSSDSLEDMDTNSEVSKDKLVQRCLESLAVCLQRFPQHYKSQYRLAHAYLNVPSIKNAKLSRDLLLGSNLGGEKPFNLQIQGLLNEKSKTNLFQGIWRVPLDDVDRPGSFCTHMYKCVKLLIDVLNELEEWDSLLLVSSLMYRSPDSGKKYLRDNERLQLASKAFTLSLKLLNGRLEQCKKLTNPSAVTTALLTDAHEAYKCSQKVQKYGEETEKLLIEVYELSDVRKEEDKRKEKEESKRSSESSIVDEILKYFQLKSQTSMVEQDEKNASQPKTMVTVDKPEVSPTTKNFDTTQESKTRKMTDVESVESSTDQALTSPMLPPLIPDAEKTSEKP